MKFAATLILLVLFQNVSIAQSSFTIEGLIVHAESKNPIPLANIGIPNINIGTASRLDGTFSLNLPQKLRKDTLHISAIGYQTKTYPIASLQYTDKITIHLDPKIYQIESITVTDRKQKPKWIGKKIPPLLSASLGIWTHPERLGAAFAFKINWDKQLPLQILYSRIFLKRNTDNPIHIRCSLTEVDPKTGMPAHPSIPKIVDISTNTQKGWATCDFRSKNLYMDSEEFFIVFEWLTPQEKRIIPMIATSPFFKSDTYIRHHALAEWKKSSVDLIYSIKVEY